MRLLVIEDNRELADLMKEKLSGFGYVCDCLLYTSPSPRD